MRPRRTAGGKEFRKKRFRDLRKGKRYITPILVVISILIAIFLIRLMAYALGVGTTIDTVLTNSASLGVEGAERGARGLVSILEIFRLPSHLKRESKLEGEVALLNSIVEELEEVRVENAELRELNSLKSAPQFNRVFAEVVGRSPDLWFDAIVINRGSSSGIGVKDLVVNSNGLVGEIMEVGGSYSKVRLLTNIDFAISAVTKLSRTQGIVRGQGPGTLKLDYIPAEAEIHLQEKVLTLGIGQSDEDARPAGILLGYVSKIRKVPGLTTLEVTVEPAIGARGFRSVLVLTRK